MAAIVSRSRCVSVLPHIWIECQLGSNWQYAALVQIMACCRPSPCDTPFSESMLTLLTDANAAYVALLTHIGGTRGDELNHWCVTYTLNRNLAPSLLHVLQRTWPHILDDWCSLNCVHWRHCCRNKFLVFEETGENINLPTVKKMLAPIWIISSTGLNIEAWTRWLTLCRRHIQIHFTFGWFNALTNDDKAHLNTSPAPFYEHGLI